MSCYSKPLLMVPCHHVTVANLHLIQLTVQIQIQSKVKKIIFVRHEIKNVHLVANNHLLILVVDQHFRKVFKWPKPIKAVAKAID